MNRKKSNYSVCSTVHYKMMNYKVMYELVADRTGSLYGDTGGGLVVASENFVFFIVHAFLRLFCLGACMFGEFGKY